MNIPDYVSPIVAYRVWGWDGSGLASLRGDSWPTGHALTAQCKRVPGHNNGHQAPQESCTCGIYAARSLGHLRRLGYARFAIYGEVYLWGVVVEHKLGWRAQFAYPRNLVVPFKVIPVDEMEGKSHLEALVAYGVDIFIDDGKERLPLWGSGYEPAGLDYMGKFVSEQVEVSVPVAVLKEDPSRHVLLQNGRVVNHSAEIVFTDMRFPVNGRDPITYELKAPHVMAVVFDLRPGPGNARLTSHAINVVRMARPDIFTFTTDIAIFVRVDSHTRLGVERGTSIRPDEYLEREGRHDVQPAYERFLRRRAGSRELITSHRGGTPPGSAGPPRLPPPPAVPVHSSWDISRILQCTRHRWRNSGLWRRLVRVASTS